VRHREDPNGRKRHKTAEIFVAQMDWDPPPAPEDRVQIRVSLGRRGPAGPGQTGRRALAPREQDLGAAVPCGGGPGARGAGGAGQGLL